MWQSGREPVSVARLPELAAGCMEQPEYCVEQPGCLEQLREIASVEEHECDDRRDRRPDQDVQASSEIAVVVNALLAPRALHITEGFALAHERRGVDDQFMLTH